MKRAVSLLDRITVLLAICSGVALTVLMAFTFVDVVLRYVFNRPIMGSIDVIQLALVVLVFLALPYTGRSDGHIVVDLVPNYPSVLATRLRDAVIKLLPAVIFGVLAWQSWVRADISVMLGEASNILEIPFRPFFYVMAAGSAIYTISLSLEFLMLVRGRRAKPLTVAVEDEFVVAE